MIGTRAWLILPVLLGALAPPVAAETAQLAVVGPPSIGGATVSQIVAGTPLAPYATQIYQLGVESHIDPAFALAIWDHESQFGTTGAAATDHNMGNLVCAAALQPPATACSGRWAVYATWPDAIADWYGYLQRRYLSRGLISVAQIVAVYAPPAENDTTGYITAVERRLRQWRSGVVAPAVPPSPAPGGGFVDDWIYRPLDQLVYNAERLLASIIWSLNQSGLWLDLLIEQLRTLLITSGFRPAIDAVATGMLGISRGVFELGLVLAFTLILLQPVIRFELVNLRKLIFLGLLLPLLLPAAGAIFQDLEQTRADIGASLYTTIFGASQGQFGTLAAGAPSGNGVGARMGPLVPFTPAPAGSSGPAMHGVDVAAAYLYATANDVMNPNNPPPDDLPDRFAQVYFGTTLGTFSAADAAQRQEAIATAGQGIVRMLYGVLLVVFALCEAATNLLFTLGMGFLLIGLALSLVFGFFVPVEHLTTGLLQQLLDTFLASWGISALQGVVLAAVFAVAASGNAVAVLGVGILALVLAVIFLVLAARTIGRALVGALGAATGGTLTPGVAAAGASLASASIGQTGAALSGISGGLGAAVAGGTAAAGGVLHAGAAYTLARRTGNDHEYATAYALAQHRPLARLGTLAAAMGVTSPAEERALWSATVIAPGHPLGLRAQRALARDAALAKAEATNAASGAAPQRGTTAPPTTGTNP